MMNKTKTVIPVLEVIESGTHEIKEGLVDGSIRITYINNDYTPDEYILDYCYDPSSRTLTIPNYSGKKIFLKYEREVEGVKIINEKSEYRCFEKRVIFKKDIAWSDDIYEQYVNRFTDIHYSNCFSMEDKDYDFGNINMANEILENHTEHVVSVYLKEGNMYIEFVFDRHHGMLYLPKFRFTDELMNEFEMKIGGEI